MLGHFDGSCEVDFVFQEFSCLFSPVLIDASSKIHYSVVARVMANLNLVEERSYYISMKSFLTF